MSQKEIYLPILFVFLWSATPSVGTSIFYFTTNELGFTPEFYGRISIISNFASLAGVLAYRKWFKAVPLKDLIFWVTIVSVPLSLTQLLLTTRMNMQLGIPDQAFSLVESSVLSVLGQLAFMPTLVLASSLCPPGVEGTLFATLMSIYNAAGGISSELGALLTSALGVTDKKFDNLSLLVFLASVSNLLPLIFINFLDGIKVKNDEND